MKHREVKWLPKSQVVGGQSAVWPQSLGSQTSTEQPLHNHPLLQLGSCPCAFPPMLNSPKSPLWDPPHIHIYVSEHDCGEPGPGWSLSYCFAKTLKIPTTPFSTCFQSTFTDQVQGAYPGTKTWKFSTRSTDWRCYRTSVFFLCPESEPFVGP